MKKNPIYWHPTKNLPLKVEDVSQGSGQKVWWQDDLGHEGIIQARAVKAGKNCVYCLNQKVLVGFNDLATLRPDLAKEWHPDNNAFAANEIVYNSERQVWWQDEYGHEWQTSVYSRNGLNSGCPHCSGLKVTPGVNDLATLNPRLRAEWHPYKNLELKPEEISVKSTQLIWWQCENGHEWQQSPHTRLNFKCGFCTGRKVWPGFNDLATLNPKLAAEWHPTKNVPLTPSDVTVSQKIKAWWQCENGHEWETWVYARTAGNNCSQCHPKYSKLEKDLNIYLEGFIETITQDRKIIKPYELDIFVPQKNIGVEFNGLYWHSEQKGKERTYHQEKWIRAKKANIGLIQIWEDDWVFRTEIVKKMLLHKLGLTKEIKVYGRKTEVQEINSETARIFLDENHIQGYAVGSYYIGLIEKETEKLVGLMVLMRNKKDNELTIVRYATSVNLVGGFTKLLKYSELKYSPSKFITFSDHTISNGDLYFNNGFVADKEIPPDYMYIVNGQRQHKFGYRLKRFRNDPELEYKAGLSERELAALNKIPRIWDAGKTRWVKPVDNQKI